MSYIDALESIDTEDLPELSEEEKEQYDREQRVREEAKSEVPETLAETTDPREAAEAVARYLRDCFCFGEHGLSDDLMAVEETEEGFIKLHWPEGPADWALLLSGGDSLFAVELGDYRGSADISLDHDGFHVEAKHGSALLFMEA